MRRLHGFTYLWLLFVVAAGAAGLAALGQRTSTALQREREAELMFRGKQIQHAIAAYWQHTPAATKELPASLQDLVDDRRFTTARHHLRRIYDDPFTFKPDWVLITTDDGRIRGVHSRAELRAMRTVDLQGMEAGVVPLVSDHQFVFDPAAVALASPIGSSGRRARNEKSSRPATLSLPLERD